MDKPGTEGVPFKLILDKDWFQVGNTLKVSSTRELIVTKVYPITRWQRFIKWLGFSITYKYEVIHKK